MAVVHELEVVEVDEEHRQAAVLAPAAGEGLGEALAERLAVREAGQVVVGGGVGQLHLGPAALDGDGRQAGAEVEEAAVLGPGTARLAAKEPEDAEDRGVAVAPDGHRPPRPHPSGQPGVPVAGPGRVGRQVGGDQPDAGGGGRPPRRAVGPHRGAVRRSHQLGGQVRRRHRAKGGAVGVDQEDAAARGVDRVFHQLGDPGERLRVGGSRGHHPEQADLGGHPAVRPPPDADVPHREDHCAHRRVVEAVVGDELDREVAAPGGGQPDVDRQLLAGELEGVGERLEGVGGVVGVDEAEDVRPDPLGHRPAEQALQGGRRRPQHAVGVSTATPGTSPPSTPPDQRSRRRSPAWAASSARTASCPGSVPGRSSRTTSAPRCTPSGSRTGTR